VSAAARRVPLPEVRLDRRRAALVAGALSGMLHLLMAGSLPLVITPDGGEYVRGALALGEPGKLAVELNRTPGYHAILYATFAVFGVGAGGILVVQALLATATCVLLTWTACGIAGPWIGLAVGLLHAVEPWSLALGNYALTETATTFFVVLAATLALGMRSAGVPAAIALGLALAAACMMRPAVQVVVPFFALAWLVRGTAPARRRVLLGGVVAATFLACAAPWLAHNAARGVRGFAGTSGTMLWYGVAMAGLLDPAYPLDPGTRAAVDRRLANGIGDWPVHQVMFDTGALRSLEQDRRLGAWARASIAARPAAYLRAVGHALLWQLNAGIPGKPPIHDELPFLAERLTWDTHQPPRGPAPNFQNAGTIPRWWAFGISWHGGVMQAYLRRVGEAKLRGIPQVPLFLAAVLACVLCALRRDWPLALVLAGTLAFFVAHGLLLMPLTRHALPAWTVWYLGLAAVLGQARSRAAALAGRS
jgi:4-amino-4-deoxy-L-arabinose transferase-like glycosyltransferase